MSDDPRFHPPNFGSAAPGGAGPVVPNLNVNVASQAVTGPGGFWIRFVAWIVDGTIVQFASFPLAFLSGIVMPIIMGGGAVTQAVIQIIGVAVNLVIIWFYYGWFYSNKGATPGKLFFGLKVLHAETGGHLTYGRTFVREIIGKLVSGILLFGGFIVAGLRSDKRALHDLMVNTQVVRTR